MRKIIYLFALAILASGCATAQRTQEQINNLDYGAPPTINCEEVIKKYCNETLLDPYSAVYEDFTAPEKYWFKEAFGKIYAGYVVFVKINAKNAMGGYTGKKIHGYIFKDNAMTKEITPEELELLALYGKSILPNTPKGGKN